MKNRLILFCISITIGSIITSIVFWDATCLKYAIGAWMVPLAIWVDKKLSKEN
jgi:hypothetical protein